MDNICSTEVEKQDRIIQFVTIGGNSLAVKSHIQAPRCILSKFVNTNLGKVYYLDIERGYIGLCGTKKIGQELGWYSDEIEAKLNKSVESPLSKICNNILGFMNGEIDTLKMMPADVEIIKGYFITSIGRSDCIDKSFAEDRFVKELYDVQGRHDLMVNLSLDVAKANKQKVNELQCGLYDNRTSSYFILPRNCFYAVTDNNVSEIIYVMPISPKVAIGLFSESYCDMYQSFKDERIIRIEDDNTIKYMNARAFQYEVVLNGKFLVSPKKEELEEVWDAERDKVMSLKNLRNQLLKRML